MSAFMLDVCHVSRRFEGVTAVNDVDFHLQPGETVGIIGPNGAGKTTLFNLIAGYDQPSAGDIRIHGQSVIGLAPHRFAGLGVARTFQHGRVFGNLTVLENVLIGAHTRSEAQSSWLGIGELAQALWQPRAARRREDELRREAIEILSLFGARLRDRLDDPAATLSYANRRRLELARALALHPNLLLLDEPTAGMNPAETAEFAETLSLIRKRIAATLLIIEHKLPLILRLADRLLVMDHGRLIADGEPSAVRQNPEVTAAYLGRSEPSAQEER